MEQCIPGDSTIPRGILREIVYQLKWKRRQEIHEQQQKLLNIMTSVIIAWPLEEKRSEGINVNQPESVRLEEDAEAAEPETPPQKPEPLPLQRSPAAHTLLLSPPEEVGGDEHEEVMVSKNMVVEVGGVMACDGGRGMMESMQMDKRKELLQQHRTSSSHSYLVLPPQTRGPLYLSRSW